MPLYLFLPPVHVCRRIYQPTSRRNEIAGKAGFENDSPGKKQDPCGRLGMTCFEKGRNAGGLESSREDAVN